jgi:hypothetical protein
MRFLLLLLLAVLSLSSSRRGNSVLDEIIRAKDSSAGEGRTDVSAKGALTDELELPKSSA